MNQKKLFLFEDVLYRHLWLSKQEHYIYEANWHGFPKTTINAKKLKMVTNNNVTALSKIDGSFISSEYDVDACNERNAMRPNENKTSAYTVICFTLSISVYITAQNATTAFVLYTILLFLNLVFWMEPSLSKLKLGSGLALLTFTAWLLFNNEGTAGQKMNRLCMLFIPIASVCILTKRLYSSISELASFQALPKIKREQLSNACYYANLFGACFMLGFLMKTAHLIIRDSLQFNQKAHYTDLLFSSLLLAPFWLMVEGFLAEMKPNESKLEG